MKIDDPHGVSELLPAATTEQLQREELEFRVVMLSFIVQQYGNWINGILMVPINNRSHEAKTMLDIYRHQMNLCQKLAVRANKRYENLQKIAEVKGNA